jgi:hypothetical protein
MVQHNGRKVREIGPDAQIGLDFGRCTYRLVAGRGTGAKPLFLSQKNISAGCGRTPETFNGVSKPI